MLRIFSCICWPFICLFWKNVYLVSLHFLKSQCFLLLFLLLIFMDSWYILDINSLVVWFANIFSHFLGCLFVGYFYCCAEAFLVWCNFHDLFFLLLLVLLVLYPKNCYWDQCQGTLPYVFFFRSCIVLNLIFKSHSSSSSSSGVRLGFNLIL